MRTPRPALFRPLLVGAGWAVACGIALAWGLSYPSFWDPDEATFETTREMIASHFDKPPLFYLLQMASFSALGATEFAARLVAAISAAAMLVILAWLGRGLFNREVGRNAALMFAVLPQRSRCRPTPSST